MQILSVLECTSCGQSLPSQALTGCGHCGAAYAVVGGDIMSFLPPGAGSALDAIDYDAVYKVDSGASDHLYRQCRKYLGDLLPKMAHSYLEIGAGTGLFTLAYLSDARPSQALITDVSAKMLTTCRQRLQTRDIDSHTKLSFALWDGTTRCFRERSFDLVAGFSVLHHVLDYQRLLDIVRDALTDNGRAVFLEPSLGFHRALFGFMSDVIQTMPVGNPAWTNDDRALLASWIGDASINVKFRGDRLALELREDKHIFDGDGLRCAAAKAGLGGCRVIPFGDENEAWTTIGVYMNQLPFRPATRAFLLEHCARLMPGPFVYLAREDRAPSFLIVLEREESTKRPTAGLAGPLPQASVHDAAEVAYRHPDPGFRYSIELFLEPGPVAAGPRVSAKGWILGDVDVRYIEIEGGDDVRFPVGAPRVDVESLINRDFRYPLQRALCCGIMAVRPQFLSGAPASAASVTVVTMAGDRYRLGRLDRKLSYLHLEDLTGVRLPLST